MSKVLLLLAFCVLPALVTAARPNKNPFLVQGLVYCDPCRAGFETSAISYIQGAKVRVVCKDRVTMKDVYSKEATTDSSGAYKLLVDEDHEDQLCDAMLISSSRPDCAIVSPGRERARVILTRDNGIASNDRFVNAMGFEKPVSQSGCTQILNQYLELDD